MSPTAPILVTGANGFVGSHIVAQALSGALSVVAAARRTSGSGAIALDVCDSASVDAAFRAASPSVVIHCAAYGVNYSDQDPGRALEVNVHGSLSVLTAAARHDVQRFIHVGSCFEYGVRADPISEDAALNPTAIYGATKAAATTLMRERAQSLGIPIVVVRPFGIWGPGEAPYRLVPQVIRACLNRSPLKLTPCEVLRDLSYVEDIAAGILALSVAREVESGTIVNIGTGSGVLLRDFVRSVAAQLGGEDLMLFGALPYRPTEMPSLVADVTRLRRLLGDRPETALAVGVQRMLPRFADAPFVL